MFYPSTSYWEKVVSKKLKTLFPTREREPWYALSAWLILTTLFCLSGCQTRDEKTTIMGDTPIVDMATPTVISLEQSNQVVATRLQFNRTDDTLSLSVLRCEPIITADAATGQPIVSLSLTIGFVNNSDHLVVIRKPESFGLGDPKFDLYVSMSDEKGRSLTFPIANAYPLIGLTSNDFISIEPSGIYTQEFEASIPTVMVEDTGYEGSILPGQYLISISCMNLNIGYETLSTETPPDFETLEQRLEWEKAHTEVRDLDAWVGALKSKETIIDVPDYGPK